MWWWWGSLSVLIVSEFEAEEAKRILDLRGDPFLKPVAAKPTTEISANSIQKRKKNLFFVAKFVFKIYLFINYIFQ